MESTMVKIRRRSGCPHIPNTYEELSQEIIAQGQRFDNVHGQSFFSGVVGEGDESAIIFIIDQMKELLVSSEELHIDGTFKCVPKKPKSLQMCTIMAVYHDQTLPVVFCLMKRRTSAVYRKIFQHLRIILPNLNPTCVISDYEAAIKSAVTSEFPEARHVGCWFHYAQCIFKKILNLGLAGAYRNDPVINKSGQMLIALALLPSEYIERGYQRIQEFFLEQTEVGEDISRKMDQLLSYFKNQWLTRVGPASFSVFQQVRRSNNAQESFHNRFMGIIGTPHPNIWNFLGALIQVAKLTIAETIALESNVQVRRNRKTKWLQQDRKIKEEQERLVSSAVTDERIERFLAVMAYRCSLRVRPVPAASAADPEEDQDDELVPLQGASDNVSHNSVSVETVLQQRRRLGEIRMNVPDQLAEEGDLTCVACRSFKRNYCVRPCNHLVLCTRCATVHRATERRDSQGRPLLVTCPLCRTVVADYIQIYL